jgi:hypothetical protein
MVFIYQTSWHHILEDHNLETACADWLTNSEALVHERTIPTERPTLVGEVQFQSQKEVQENSSVLDELIWYAVAMYLWSNCLATAVSSGSTISVFSHHVTELYRVLWYSMVIFCEHVQNLITKQDKRRFLKSNLTAPYYVAYFT